MVHIKKRLSLTMLLSLAAFFSISATETISLDDLDMTEATLAIFPKRVRTEGLDEDLDLFYDKEGFFVRTPEEDIRVQKHFTDTCLRGRSVKDIAKYAALGKFKISKFDNDEYAVHSCGELKGGGPVLAACAGISVRVIGYSGWAVCALTIPGFVGTGPAAFAIIENAANYGTAVGFLTPSI